MLGRTKLLGVAEINAKKLRFEELKTAVHWFHIHHKQKVRGIGDELDSDLIRRLQGSIDDTDE